MQMQISQLQLDYQDAMDQYYSLVAANEGIVQQINTLEQDTTATQEDLDALAAKMQENIEALKAIIAEGGQLDLLTVEMENLTSQVQANTNAMTAFQEELLPELERLSQIMNNILAGKCSNGRAIREILSDGTLVCESGPLLISPGASWPGELVEVESTWIPAAETRSYTHYHEDCGECGTYDVCVEYNSCWYDLPYIPYIWYGENPECGCKVTLTRCEYCSHTHNYTVYPYSEFSLSVSCPPGHILTQWGYQKPFSSDAISENRPTVTIDINGNAIAGYVVHGEHAESSMQTYVTANATCMAMP